MGIQKNLEMDKESDVLSSLELVSIVLPLVLDKPQFWKWVIIGLHNALQGLMVLSLYTGAGFELWKEKDRNDWLARYYKGIPHRGRRHLDNFSNLYKMIQSDRKMARAGGRVSYL